MLLLHLSLLQSSQIAQILLQRPRRPPPEYLSRPAHLLPTQPPRPAPQNHPRPHGSVLPNPHLPAENRSIFDDAGTRNPGLRGSHHILPNHAVMPDVHQVIDLRPPPDPGLPQGPAVDRGIRPDLDIVFDHQRSLLGKQQVLSARIV